MPVKNSAEIPRKINEGPATKHAREFSRALPPKIAPRRSQHPGPEPSKIEFLPRHDLDKIQLERLRDTVANAYARVVSFREKMDAWRLVPEFAESLEVISLLPLTRKEDLRRAAPLGHLAVPLDRVVRLHASSGTTGEPVAIGYTQGDIQVWAEVMERTLLMCGVRKGDVLQNSYGYGLFTGGLGIHYGAERLGTTVIPASGGNTARQIALMRNFGTTVICCTPSYFLHVADKAEASAVDLRRLHLRIGVFGAEPWSEEMRRRIEEVSGLRAYDIYGLSEVIGPGVAAECEHRTGLHVFEDHFYPEVIDPDTGCALAEGEEGELVLTTLTKQAMPMIRFRTGDITALIPGNCPCGRTLRRIRRISRRCDDVLVVRGVNVYPSQVEAALMSVAGTRPHYQIVLMRRQFLDRIRVEVEVRDNISPPSSHAHRVLHAQISTALRNALGLTVELRLLKPYSLPRSEGKAKRVIDTR